MGQLFRLSLYARAAARPCGSIDRSAEKTSYKVKLMSGESLNYNPEYSNALLEDVATAKYIDMIGGHLYGRPPLDYMAKSAVLATKLGKEVWTTEYNVENENQLDCEYGKLLRRGYVMFHFSKHITGSTRLGTTASVCTNTAFEMSAYVKGDFCRASDLL